MSHPFAVSHNTFSGDARVHIGHVYHGDTSARVKEPTNFKFSPWLPIYTAPNYVVRPEQNASIFDCVTPGKQVNQRTVFVIHGLAGTGKTQLMLHFARQYQEYYDSVWLIDGSSSTTVNQSFVQIAGQIAPHADQVLALLQAYQEHSELSLEKSSPEVLENKLRLLIEGVLHWFNHNHNKRWLLLFDNVDREFLQSDELSYDVTKCFPAALHGTIIITTRHLPYSRLGVQGSLTLFTVTDEQAVQILSHSSGILVEDFDNTAKALVQRLGWLPLAIVQAGNYIKETSSDYIEYLEDYEKVWKELMSDDIAAGAMTDFAHGPITMTWNISFQFVKKRDPTAATALRLLAILHHTEINQTIFGFSLDFTRLMSSWEAPPEIVRRLYTPVGYNNIMRVLLQYALVQQLPDSQSFEMHPVLHDWCLYSMDSEGERQEMAVLALRLLGAALEHRQGTKHLQDYISPHVSRCLSILGDDVEKKFPTLQEPIAKNLLYIGRVLDGRNVFKAHKLLERSYAIFKELRGPFDDFTQSAARSLVRCYISSGLYNEAEDLHKQMLVDYGYQGRLRILGEHHSDTIVMGLEYASMLIRESRMSEAQCAIDRVRGVRVKQVRNRIQDDVTNLFYVAQYERLKGNLSAAISLYTQCLSIGEHFIAPSEPKLLIAIYAFAKTYVKLGRSQEARPLYERFLKDAAGVAAVEEQYCSSLYDLGVIHRRQGDNDTAMSYAERCLEMMTRYYDKTHWAPHAARWQIAKIRTKEGRLSEAAKLYDGLVAMLVTSMPKAPSDIVISVLASEVALRNRAGDVDERKTACDRMLCRRFNSGRIPHRQRTLYNSSVSSRVLAMYLSSIMEEDRRAPVSVPCTVGHDARRIRRTCRQHPSVEVVDDFYQCRVCYDKRFCEACYKELMNGSISVECSREHSIMHVRCSEWRYDKDIKSLVNGEGIPVKNWRKHWMQDFLGRRRREDPVFMEWLDEEVEY